MAATKTTFLDIEIIANEVKDIGDNRQNWLQQVEFAATRASPYGDVQIDAYHFCNK